MHTLTWKCQPAAIFIWCLAICAQGLSGRWHYGHLKLPQIYLSHVNMSHNKFKVDLLKTDKTAVFIEVYECMY